METLDTANWSVERKLLVATFLSSILAFTFGLGVNYAKITQQEAELNAFKTTVPSTYLRRDVYESDQRRLSDAITRLTEILNQTEAREARVQKAAMDRRR